MLLGEVDVRLALCRRFAQCFTDYRDQRFVEHSVEALVRQRAMGMCLGYEDLNDHDTLSLDPLLTVACGKTDPEGKGRTNKPAREKGQALAGHEIQSQALYEQGYCLRGDMENRIKESQLDLFADRASSHLMRANQLRVWFSVLAYVLMNGLRNHGLKKTRLAKATSGTIRTFLLKIGARVVVSVRRVIAHLSSAAPYRDVYAQAWRNLRTLPLRC